MKVIETLVRGDVCYDVKDVQNEVLITFKEGTPGRVSIYVNVDGRCILYIPDLDPELLECHILGEGK